MEELMQMVKQFCEERNWTPYHNPKDLAIGISTEANELLDIFRFKNEKEMQELFQNSETKTHIGEEVADVLFFLLRFAQLYQLDLKSCMEDKLVKNAIKYPVEGI